MDRKTLDYIIKLKIGKRKSTQVFYRNKIEEYYNNIDLTGEERRWYESDLYHISESNGFSDLFFEYHSFCEEYEEAEDFTDEQKAKFREAIRNLTKRQEEVIDLLLKDYTFMEISKKIGLSTGACRSTIYGNSKMKGGAIRKLRKILGVEK